MATLLFILIGGAVLAWAVYRALWKRAVAQTDAEFAAARTETEAESRPEPTRPADLDFEPILCRGYFDWDPESGHESDLLVVGESFHSATFLALAGGDRTRNGEREGTAFLVAEPENRFDSNAVGVWVPEGQVGYIPKDVAAAWQEIALALRSRQQVLTVPCWIGWGPGPEWGDNVWRGSARLRWDGDPPSLDDPMFDPNHD